MSKKQYALLYAGLTALAALCAAVAWQGGSTVWTLYPWKWIGDGLRALSLAGAAGNAAAWALYLAVCLCPALLAWRYGFAANWPLALLSAALLPALYAMVNPGTAALGNLTADMALALWAQLLWALLAAWAVLRIVGAVRGKTGTAALLGFLRAGLCVLDAVFLAGVFYTGLFTLHGRMDAVRQANTALAGQALAPTMALLAAGWLVQSLPALLDVGIVHALLRLLDRAQADRYADDTLCAARRCARLAAGSAGAGVLAQAAFLAVQMGMAGQVQRLDAALHLDLLPLLFALAALLLSRQMAEGRALRDENEGFI